MKANEWTVNIEAEGFVATQGDKRVVAQDLDTLIVELRNQEHPRRDAVVYPDPIPAIGAEAKL